MYKKIKKSYAASVSGAALLKRFWPVFVVEQVVFYILRNRYVLKRHVVFAHERYSFLLFL